MLEGNRVGFMPANLSLMIAILSLLSAAAVVILTGPNAQHGKLRSFSVLFPFAIIASQFLSGILVAPDVTESYAPQLVLALAFAVLIPRFAFAEISRSFLIAVVALVAVGWIVELGRISPFPIETSFANFLETRWTGLFSHPNASGLAISLAIVLLLFARKTRPLLNTALLMTLIATEFRSGLVAIAILYSFTTITWLYSRLKIPRVLGAGVVLIVAAVASNLYLRPRDGENDITTGRLDIWGYCLDVIDSQGIAGGGPALLERTLGTNLFSELTPYHCHNQVLDDLVNFGLVGGLVTFSWIVWSLFRVAPSTNVSITSGLLTVFLVTMIFESQVRVFAPAPYLWIFAFFVALTSDAKGLRPIS